MALNYEDIVRDWYMRLRPEFLRRLTAKYPCLTLGDAENLYQDAFMAVQENLVAGRVREDTSWRSYILTIGMNMAGKFIRDNGIPDSIDEPANDISDSSTSKTARAVEELHKTMPEGEETLPLCRDENALSLLGDALTHTPEPCGSIIRLFYYSDLSMDEIAEEIGYKNAATAKAKKSQCMNDLIARVTGLLRAAGYDVTPKKRNRNGKN